MGEVGVNTGNFTSTHKLHIEGGALADYSAVQPVADWGTDDDYVGMYFSDKPEIKWNSDATSYFEFKAADTGEVPLRLTSSGKVGINTDEFVGDHSLYIEGSSIAEEMFVKLTGEWPDYVFNDNYDLMPLNQLETFIKEHGHLPNLPNAEEVRENGLPLGETERVLTEKIEELTLYMLELKNDISELNTLINNE